MPEIIPPPFIIFPYQLVTDAGIRPLDRIVYGAIWWFASMKKDKCYASNQTLAKLVGSSPRSVQNSLTRLERKRYIIRIYKNDSHYTRDQIIPLVSPHGDRLSPLEDRRVSPAGDHKKNMLNKNIKSEQNDFLKSLFGELPSEGRAYKEKQGEQDPYMHHYDKPRFVIPPELMDTS